jgi:hypothetical protein
MFVTEFGDYMQNLEKGFMIGESFVPWGTTMEEACRLFGIRPGQGPYSSHDARLICANAYGFAAVCTHLTAPADDRPIMNIAFELAPAPAGTQPPDPEYWMAPLSEQLGKPTSVNRSDIPSYADPADCVPFYAGWEFLDTGVGLSVYGGLREVEGGKSAGTLWLSWNERRAAQPYLEEWRERVARIASIAEQPSQLQRFVLDLAQNACYSLTGKRTPEALAARQARICLYRPSLLETPARIAAQLKPHDFALWSSEPHAIWCVSTRYDSMMFEIGQPARVVWIDLQPAKGSGYSALEFEGWTLYGSYGARAIREASQMLGRFPGVTVKQESGYDC